MKRLARIGLAIALAGACSTKAAAPTAAQAARVQVVASTSAWGSLVAQVGGDRVQVTSIVANPDADPHDYEPTADDARAISTAQYVVFNGVGYDEWARKVVQSNASATQTTLDIGALVGVNEGDNPHRWYFPGDVRKVVSRITDDLKKIDPAHAADLDRNRAAFEANDLSRYNALIDTIRQRYSGVPVGASESLFTGIADATGLQLATPLSFLAAISEGIDPSVQDKTTAENQITNKAVKVYVFNPQNSTPDITTLVDAANRQGIPVVTFTETLVPSGATFVDWQVAQLQALSDALASATGR